MAHDYLLNRLKQVRKIVLFKKVFDKYCQLKGVVRSSKRFIFDGNVLADVQTVADVDMDDMDLIDCMNEVVGGSSLVCRKCVYLAPACVNYM